MSSPDNVDSRRDRGDSPSPSAEKYTQREDQAHSPGGARPAPRVSGEPGPLCGDDDPILAAFGHRARRCRHRPVLQSGDRSICACELQRASNQIARRLSEAGALTGSLIALSSPSGPTFLAGLLATRTLRATSLLLDPHSPVLERRRTAATFGARFALETTAPFPRREREIRLVAVEGAPKAWQLEGREDVAVVKLTSGSTGRPRGIVTRVEHLVADDRALATTMDLSSDERIFAAVPMSHSYGLSSVAMPALMRDSTLVVPPRRFPLDPLADCEAHRATFLPTVPAVLSALTRRNEIKRLPRSLRLVVSAGAPLSTSTARRFHERYDQPIHVFYGASECGGITFDRRGDAAERGTLGTAVDGVSLDFLEPSSLSPRSEGSLIVIDSPAVAEGYLDALDDPGAELGGGVFSSQDIGRLRNGELVLEGRSDEAINIKGKLVHPHEVDSVIERLDGVDSVVTLADPGPRGIEPSLRSFVACRPGHELSYDDIRRWCRRRLVSYKIPRRVIFVSEIPRTSRGKIDRKRLIELAR